MRGVVLKSHWWPTAVAVPYIQQLYQGPVQLWSSIVLNPIAGGEATHGAGAPGGIVAGAQDAGGGLGSHVGGGAGSGRVLINTNDRSAAHDRAAGRGGDFT